MNRKLKLTGELQKNICAFIRAGGFAHVAAEAAGVPVALFEQWLKWGEATHKAAHRKQYIAFREAVLQAQSEARLAAEIQAYQ